MDELYLISLPNTQAAIYTEVEWVEYRPTGHNIDNTPIDIIIPGSSDY